MRFVAVLFTVFALLSVGRMLHTPEISPDSIVYMTGAKNLLVHGDYRLMWNYPNVTPIPQIVPITDYPPGYSLAISAAMRLDSDPLRAAYLVQTAAIVALYAALYGVCRLLELRPLTMTLLITWLTCTAGWQLVTRAIWTETLFTALCLGVLVSMLKWQGTKRDRWLYAAWGMLVASVLIKYMGIGNAVPIVWILWQSKDRWPVRLMATAMLAALPPALWMLRNVALIGHTSALHRAGETFMTDKLLTPVTFYAGTLGIGAALVIALMVWALSERTRYVALLVLVTAGHFAAVYLPSLVTQINSLDDRLLFTVTTFAAVTVAVGMQGLWSVKLKRQRAIRRALLAIAVAVLFTVPTLTGLDVTIGSVYEPPERALWERLHRTHPSAVYFVSGNVLIHQVYADMPQVVVWDDASDFVRIVDAIEVVQSVRD